MINILVVDDEKTVTEMAKIVISGSRFNTHVVSKESIQDALMYLAKVSGQETFPHFIFLDIYFPDTNCWEFLNKYEKRFYESHPATRIVIHTVSQEEKDRNRAFQYSSVSGFEPKMITTTRFEEIVEKSFAVC